jgi:hypothetical protein
METADRVDFEFSFLGGFVFNVRRARDAMPVQTTTQ